MQYTIIKNNIKAQTEGVEVLPICLYGAPGIGKSSVIDQAAKELNLANNTVSISSVNYENFSGLPTFSVDTGLDKYSSSNAKDVQNTIWTIPEIIASTNRMAEANENGCVLHLEDFHTMDKTTENVMYQLLLDRKLGDYMLHPKVAIIASMNHSKESGGGHFNSAAVKSRLSLMEYRFNFTQWYNNFGSALHPWVSSFLKTNQQYSLEPESQTLEPSGSPRSYTKLSLDFNLYDAKLLKDVYLELAKGKVSINALNALEKHVIYYKKIDFTAIVKNRQIPVLKDLPDLDKVLYGYVFHSIETIEDAVYLIDLVNDIMKQPHYESTIGFLAAEIYSKYKIKSEGGIITKGQEIVLSKIMGDYDPSKYKISKALETKLNKASFDNAQEVMTTMSEYIN